MSIPQNNKGYSQRNTKKTESMYFKIRNEITMPGFYSLIQQYVQHSYLLITTFFYLDHHLGENLF